MIQLGRLELTTVVNITYAFEPFCKLLKHNNSHLVAEVLTFQFFDSMLSGGDITQGNLPLMLQLFAPQILIQPHLQTYSAFPVSLRYCTYPTIPPTHSPTHNDSAPSICFHSTSWAKPSTFYSHNPHTWWKFIGFKQGTS